MKVLPYLQYDEYQIETHMLNLLMPNLHLTEFQVRLCVSKKLILPPKTVILFIKILY